MIPTDFRLIALCNVLMKLVTNTIDFMNKRLITDNYMNHTKQNMKGYVGIKLDMEKAYDRL